jgi:hypothetical protein
MHLYQAIKDQDSTKTIHELIKFERPDSYGEGTSQYYINPSDRTVLLYLHNLNEKDIRFALKDRIHLILKKHNRGKFQIDNRGSQRLQKLADKLIDPLFDDSYIRYSCMTNFNTSFTVDCFKSFRTTLIWEGFIKDIYRKRVGNILSEENSLEILSAFNCNLIKAWNIAGNILNTHGKYSGPQFGMRNWIKKRHNVDKNFYSCYKLNDPENIPSKCP